MAAARTTRERVIVLGADVEGLAAAATLARAGRAVVLVDGARAAGGVHAAREFHPGFRAGSPLHEAGLSRAALLAPLGLEGHGLAWRATPARTLVPLADGRAFALGAGELAGLPGEAEAFERWSHLIERLAPLVQGLLDAPPPDLGTPSALGLVELLRKAFALRGHGARFVEDVLRIAPSSAMDWLGECFAEPALAAALAAPALAGTCFGPRSPATSALVLLVHAARGSEPEGGLAGLAQALEAAARAAGADLRLGRAPRRILVEHGRAAGVELEGGERLEAGAVLSALDPVTTLLGLVLPGTLAPSLEQAVRTFRARGATASLALALSRPPRWSVAGPDGGAPERLLTARSLLELERASDPWKYNELPRAPWLDVRVEPAARAPTGAAALSVLVQGVPSAPGAGGASGRDTFACRPWSEAQRAELVSTVLGILERHAPGLSASVVGHELLVPSDLEQRFGLRGGHLLGGELALDQLLLTRPCLTLARYRTPIEGLVLGSTGSHPGGPFAGGAGVLAARALGA